MNHLHDLRRTGADTLANAKNLAAWKHAVRRIETTVRDMPVRYLQNLGRKLDPFLYDYPIQRNSVILIDQIEQDRARGVPAWDAIVESAVRRLRPIVLTAAAAVLAMIPLSRSVFWGPMAVAIMGGLVVATVLTLLALPAMYAAWFRVRRPVPEVA